MGVWRTPRPNDSFGYTNNLFAPAPSLSPGATQPSAGSPGKLIQIVTDGDCRLRDLRHDGLEVAIQGQARQLL